MGKKEITAPQEKEKYQEKKNVFSKHIFLFPFTWGMETERHEISAAFEKDSRWERDIFSINKAADYNMYVYFHDFVRPALFDMGRDEENTPVRSYKLLLNKGNSTYKICKKDNECEGKCKNLELDVCYIGVNLYDTGIGVLSFELENTKSSQSDLKTIIEINEFGRRIYPQFLGERSEEKENYIHGIETTQSAFLAKTIELDVGHERIYTDRLLSKYPPQKEYPLSENLKISEVITGVLPDSLSGVKPVLDDRMYVVCWYGNDALAKSFTTKMCTTYAYATSDEWYRFLFVDVGEPTVANDFMKKQLLERHTYARWVGNQQLFGISRYSMVCLTDVEKVWISNHVTGMYYKMLELSLAQRSSVLKFSHRTTEIANKIRDYKAESSRTLQDIGKEVNALVGDYIVFQNCLFFREVTAQEQGIELYDMIQHSMRTERDIKELDRELDELKEFINMMEEKEQTKIANSLSWIATIFLPASLIAGVLGMNTMPDPVADKLINGEFHWPFFLSLVLLLVGTCLFVCFFKLKKEKR